MSDLISRSELIENFRKCYSGHLGMENSDACMTFHGICNVINNTNTAYDIDKVVEELEKLADDSNNYMYECYFNGKEDGIREAIEIVKQGNVSDASEDICEWELKNVCYTTSIKHYYSLPTSIIKTFKYCPYCGKKIKVVE